MSNIFTPTNQKLLTNISVVRLNRKGKRFEIACYPNKVTSWRDGVEKDINEVLQVPDTVFVNVSKGEVAKKDLLEKCFEKPNGPSDVCLLILKKGELRLTEKERKEIQESMFKEISFQVAERCIDSETKFPVQAALVQIAMKELHFNVKPNKDAKSQAVALIPKLAEIIPIARVEMKVKVELPAKEGKKLLPQIKEILKIDSEEKGEEFILVGLCHPGGIKKLTTLVEASCRGRGKVSVVSTNNIV